MSSCLPESFPVYLRTRAPVGRQRAGGARTDELETRPHVFRGCDTPRDESGRRAQATRTQCHLSKRCLRRLDDYREVECLVLEPLPGLFAVHGEREEFVVETNPPLPQHLSQKKAVLLLPVRSRVEPNRASRPLGERDPLAELGFVECVQQMLRLETEVGLERDHRSGIRHVNVHRTHASDVLNHEIVRLFDVCKRAMRQHANRRTGPQRYLL